MKEFKPFEKVLIKYQYEKTWQARFFSHIDERGNYNLTSGGIISSKDSIIPYKDNEYLLGTTNEPEEEIILEKGEKIVCSDSINKLLNSYGVVDSFSEVGDNIIYDSEGCPWNYCIPYSQFKEKNTEHDILCVQNGKLVRYE